jgi:hypothetical protein
MQLVEITQEFIGSMHRRGQDFSLDGMPDPVDTFKPPREWHREKYNQFIQKLLKQNPRTG